MAVSLSSLPRELVHILACLTPLASAMLVRANRSVWMRFRNDPFVWTEAIRWLQASKDGRAVLCRHAPAILAWCPPLARAVPMPVAEHADYFDVAPMADSVAFAQRSPEEIFLLDGASLRPARAAYSYFGYMFDLAVSPSGSLVACVGRKNITVFEQGSVAAVQLDSGALDWYRVCFLPDGTVVCGSVEGVIVLWNSHARSPHAAVAGAHAIVALASSATAFASGRVTGLVEVWSHAGTPLLALKGHDEVVYELAFSADGARLVSACKDGTSRVWDVASGACVHVHDFKAGWVRSVALSPAGLLAVALPGSNEVRCVQLEDGAVVSSVATYMPFRVRFARGGGGQGGPPRLFFSANLSNFPLLAVTV